MRLSAATFAPGFLVSPVLFALFCWPFLVVWVLWASRRPVQAGLMARFGAGLSLLALLGCSSGLGWGQALCLGLSACVPALFATLDDRQPPAGTEKASSSLTGMAVCLPSLVAGCILTGLLLRPPLAVLFLDGAGAVLLAWWDGRATRRALPAWEMLRLRLSGVVLAGLGFVVMRGGPVFSSAGTAAQLGQVLALAGLCMMAGLGGGVSGRAGLALLDVGLRFIPLFLMPSLMTGIFIHRLMILAGLLALAVMLAGRPRRLPLLPWLVALGLLAAGTGQILALLLLYATALLAMALQAGCEGLADADRMLPPETAPGMGAGSASGSVMVARLAALPGQLVLPVVMVVLMVLALVSGWVERIMLLACVMPGLWQLRLEGLSSGLVHFWQRGGGVARGLLLLSGILALLAIGLLMAGLMPEGAPYAAGTR